MFAIRCSVLSQLRSSDNRACKSALQTEIGTCKFKRNQYHVSRATRMLSREYRRDMPAANSFQAIINTLRPENVDATFFVHYVTLA